MFKDYYETLEIKKAASQIEIRAAFKKQAVKWHPDRNPDFDTTEKMQEINEAYLILKDQHARQRYDLEYEKFNIYKDKSNNNQNKTKCEKTYEEYQFEDETLKKWMQNAKNQAVELAKQTIKEMAELSIKATKEAGSKMIETFISYSLAGLLIMILFRACN
jgi:curved DNA-binding protein CbpA